jgi:adenylyltransferase/sulfurtransferase
MVPSCAEGGVLGVLPGIIGSIQAAEVIKVLTGIGKPLSGKLMLVDTLDFSFRKINIKKNPANPISGDNKTLTKLIDYDKFCGLESNNIQSIDVANLNEWIQKGSPFKLIDVREKYEYEVSNLGGLLIPIKQIENHLDKIPKSGNIILYCKSGQRSAGAISYLNEKYGYENLINLEGGIISWRTHFDPDMLIA